MITVNGIDSKMTANNLEPFEPTHPGEVLKDEIAYRGISQRKLAAQMGVPYTQLNEVLNAKRQLTVEYALLIEAILDLPAEPLLKMQTRYNMIVAKRTPSFIEKLKNVRRIAAVL